MEPRRHKDTKVQTEPPVHETAARLLKRLFGLVSLIDLERPAAWTRERQFDEGSELESSASALESFLSSLPADERGQFRRFVRELYVDLTGGGSVIDTYLAVEWDNVAGLLQERV